MLLSSRRLSVPTVFAVTTTLILLPFVIPTRTSAYGGNADGMIDSKDAIFPKLSDSGRTAITMAFPKLVSCAAYWSQISP